MPNTKMSHWTPGGLSPSAIATDVMKKRQLNAKLVQMVTNANFRSSVGIAASQN